MDLLKVKQAIEVVESASGENSYPRFEVSYAPKGWGRTIQGHLVHGTGDNWNALVAQRWKRWGMASACSFGAAQLLYHTAADLGFPGHPATLWVEQAMHDVYVMKRLVQIEQQGATTIEQFADAWNSGSWRDKFQPQEYMTKVKEAFNALG